ncbi:MAG TPA: YndJ family transporter [Egibacteraceae bacterium]|nr:YndJ family transporter [Egibacteraceae bacterium]
MSWQAGLGAGVWLLLVGGDLAGVVSFGLITALLALAPLVVVPLGLELSASQPPTPVFHVVRLVQPVGALAVVGALAMPAGVGAAVLAGAWLAVCLGVSAEGVGVWWRRPSLASGALARVAGFVSLSVGGAWLVLDRFGVRPLALPVEIVELTAVHFHYAGFAAALIAGTAAGAVAPERRRLAAAATFAVLAGSPVVAAGFAVYGPLQIGGAVLLATGLLLLAWITVRHVPRVADRPAQVLLVVSSVAVVVPMVLAVQWAVGHNLGTPALSIADMALVHGVPNAFGFTLCGLLGWLRAGRLEQSDGLALKQRDGGAPDPALKQRSGSDPNPGRGTAGTGR